MESILDNRILRGVNKIAVFRATALGDFIMAIPALRALNDTYPQAEIVYLGRKWHSEFLPGRLPGISRIICVPPPRGNDIIDGYVIDPIHYDEFMAQMVDEHFELAVQMHGGGMRSNPFIQAFGARVSIGTKNPDALPLDRWVPYVYYQHETARCLEVVSLVGAQTLTDNLSPSLTVLDSDTIAARAAMAQIRNPYVVVHAGATDPRRRWPPSHFAAVADYCAEVLHMDVVLTGTQVDEISVMAVERQMRTHPINMLNQLSLQGLTGLLSKAALVISNDSGPMHLAYTVGAKTIGLFTAEALVNFLPLNRKLFHPLIAFDRRCPTCGTFCDKAELDRPSGPCSHWVSFLSSLPVEHVLQAVHHVLDS
jgi:ADP-heptose:LPS heptosyltransferase